MKGSFKRIVLKAAAKAALGTAKMASGAASTWDSYQPKEPKALKSAKK